MTGTSGATRDTGLYEVDSVNVADVMQTASVPWRHMTTNYAIERREIAMNTGAAQIVDLVKIRRHDAMVDLAKHLEERFWSKPDTSADNLKMFGVPYWICWGAGTQGFNGGNPDGFSAGAAGLDSSTYSQWQNYTDTYAVPTAADLVTKWRRASTFTKFMAPQQSPSYGSPARYGYYTDYTVIASLEAVLAAQNDNLGYDIASQDGKVVFRGTPVTWVPFLEGRAGGAIYGINWGNFKPAFLSGEYLREEGPVKASNQHTVFQTHLDLTMNMMCTDRRSNFVLATEEPDPTV